MRSGHDAEQPLGNLTCTMALEPNFGVGTFITITENHYEFLTAFCDLKTMADFSIDVNGTPIHEIMEMVEDVLTHLKERAS